MDDPDQIRALRGRQLTETVLWQTAMESMVADGHDEMWELGPGRVLSGLLQRIAPTARSRAADKAEELAALLEEEAA